MARERNFTRDASHELRTPLTVIRVASDMALGDETLQPRLRRSLQRIQRAGRDMEAVIDAFLILAREADVEPQIELFDVNDIVRYEVDNANELLGSRLVSVHLHSDGPVQLHSAAGAAGGDQQPGAQCLQLHRRGAHRRACAQRPGGSARYRYRHVCRRPVAGLRTVLPRRAEPPQGTGLGLSIVRRLCDRFGWKVRLASEPGKGTEATVIFR